MINLPGPLLKVFSTLCADVDTPRSLACYMLAKYGELHQLVSRQVKPGEYLCSESYMRDAVVTEFLRKCELPSVASEEQLKSECWARFRATELQCAATNKRLERFVSVTGLLDQPNDARILCVIQKAQDIIRQVLGRPPAHITGRFGPGATLTNPSRRSTIPDKISSTPTGTARAMLRYAMLFRQEEHAWLHASTSSPHKSLKVVAGSRFFTVPKTALSYRGACLSPNVNGFLQLGIGNVIRQRLKNVGIHIKAHSSSNAFSVNSYTTADKHRGIVEEASRTDAFATIDLSDASNTIAFRLIQLLWPREWFEILSDLREPFVEGPHPSGVGSATYRLEMFSAMGNGFTFEMETLTFYAIVKALCPNGFVSVFGDDIICPSKYARDALSALKFFGFTPNSRKTFIEGPFRESCGSDYFDGIPVRAHYVKSVPREPSDWIALANGLRRVAFSDLRTHHRWSYLQRTWLRVLDNIPSTIRRCIGPVELGDAVIHDSPDRLAKLARYQTVNGITRWRACVPIPYVIPLSKWEPDIVMASALYGVPSTGVAPRDAIRGYTIEWLACSCVSYAWEPAHLPEWSGRRRALSRLAGVLIRCVDNKLSMS